MDNKLNITSVWKSQLVPEPKAGTTRFTDMANTRLKYSASKHKLTTAILIGVLIVLFCFTIMANYNSLFFYPGIGLMMLALIIRISVEWYSFVLLKRTNVVRESLNYLEQIRSYFKKRKNIHKPCTVATVSLYVAGFIFLVLSFYNIVPYSFFLYIIVSFVVGFIVLTLVIRKKVQKELDGFREIIMGLEKTIEALSREE